MLHYLERADWGKRLSNKKGRGLKQMIALWKLYTKANGRDPIDLDELERWLSTPQGQTALTPLLGKDGKIVTDRRKFNGDARRFAGRSG